MKRSIIFSLFLLAIFGSFIIAFLSNSVIAVNCNEDLDCPSNQFCSSGQCSSRVFFVSPTPPNNSKLMSNPLIRVGTSFAGDVERCSIKFVNVETNMEQIGVMRKIGAGNQINCEFNSGDYAGLIALDPGKTYTYQVKAKEYNQLYWEQTELRTLNNSCNYCLGEGARECTGDLRYKRCVQGANGCFNWASEEVCTPGTRCISGACVYPNPVNSCPGGTSQQILSLYTLSNSLGALWDNTAYRYKICYDSIFGVNYTGNNPHQCSSGDENIILKLNSIMGAHALNASVESVSYPNKVCYGDLRCSLYDGACPSGKTFVLSLTANNNAHLSSDNSGRYKVCCSRGLAGDINLAYWMKNNAQITMSYINDTVVMIAETGFAGGNAVFNIYEMDGNARQNIRVGNALNATIGTDGKVSLSWKITDNDIASGIANDASQDLQFYFNVSIPLQNLSKTSGILNVSKETIINPVAIITSPNEDGVYFMGNNITFSHSSTGRGINVSWNIEGITSAQKISNSFNYSFSTPGLKHIILNVTDDRGVSSVKRININVINTSGGIHVYPLINSPQMYSEITGNSIAYNGSNGYVLNVSGLPNMNITCLGGNCPATINQCPIGYSGVCPIPVVNIYGKKGNYSEMFFNWTFKGNEALGSEYDYGKINGIKVYDGAGNDRYISLKLNAFGESEFTFNTFTIKTEGTTIISGCQDSGRLWYEGGVGYSTAIAGNCGGSDHKVGGTGSKADCCPSGQTCTDTSSGIKCVSDSCTRTITKSGNSQTIKVCDDYNYVSGDKEDKCNLDCNDAASSSQQRAAVLGGLNINERIDSISCSWVNNKCTAQYTKSSTVNGETYQCEMEVSAEGECQGNEKVISYTYKRLAQIGGIWTVVPDVDSKCQSSGTVRIRCGGSTLELPFFNYINLIVSLLVIFSIYYIAGRKR